MGCAGVHHFRQAAALVMLGLLTLCSVPELDELVAQRPIRGEAVRADDGDRGRKVLLVDS